MKKLLPLFISSLILNSCGEFEQKELTEGPASKVQGQAGLTTATLGDLNSINSGTFELSKMITNIGVNVIAPATTTFKNNANDLNKKVQTFCAVAQTMTTDTNVYSVLKEELKESFKTTMNSYHRLEAAKYGPISFNEEELGLKIYSWPLVNACRVDLEIAKQSRNGEFELKLNANTRGLDALEALILVEDDAHNCPRANRLLNQWLEKTVDQRRVERCAYMKLAANDLLEQATVLEKSWDIRKDNYTLSMTAGKKPAENIEVAKVISQALFYLEEVVKDQKIGTGRKNCAKLTEHAADPKLAASSILENLKGFQQVFNGISPLTKVNGFGYDDYLRHLEFETVANDINAQTLAAISSFEDLLNNQVEISKQDICAKFDDVRNITNILKGEFLLALGKDSAPSQSQGDMD
ncbi:imelysin family protein [Bacteriovorax sp. DB6_IX]|uniref:imelysin family protein n=1 Tax=Bacteriovorax sp. DB6_IX TaxID=1353530 RepID=UPI00054DB587|nr:imelysin family protein [Bacteriovorax sp. DB6_IX]